MNDLKRNRKVHLAAVILCICLFAVMISGCGGAGTAKTAGNVSEESPGLSSVGLKGSCEGGEKDQYIIADLNFDKDISYNDELAKQIRIVIGGQRIKEDVISFSSPQKNCLEIRIPITQVNDGMMEITNAPGCDILTALTDSNGKNCVASLNVKKLIPSGAAVSSRRRAPPGAAPAGACPWGRAGPIRAGDRRAIWEAFLQAWPARKPPFALR